MFAESRDHRPVQKTAEDQDPAGRPAPIVFKNGPGGDRDRGPFHHEEALAPRSRRVRFQTAGRIQQAGRQRLGHGHGLPGLSIHELRPYGSGPPVDEKHEIDSDKSDGPYGTDGR